MLLIIFLEYTVRFNKLTQRTSYRTIVDFKFCIVFLILILLFAIPGLKKRIVKKSESFRVRAICELSNTFDKQFYLLDLGLSFEYRNFY